MAEYIDLELLIDTIHHRVPQLVCFVPDNDVAIITPNSATMRVVGLRDLLGHIKSIPTADVVEVVRCKDCKYWNNGDCYRLELSMPNDFCSYGQRWTERRQNDEHIR